MGELGRGDDRSVPVSNALFLRSTGVGVLPPDSMEVFKRHCAPVHQLLLSTIKPHVIICFGVASWKFITGLGDPGHWNFNRNISLNAAGIDYQPCGGVLLLPHLARSGPSAWLQNKETLAQAIKDARDA